MYVSSSYFLHCSFITSRDAPFCVARCARTFRQRLSAMYPWKINCFSTFTFRLRRMPLRSRSHSAHQFGYHSTLTRHELILHTLLYSRRAALIHPLLTHPFQHTLLRDTFRRPLCDRPPLHRAGDVVPTPLQLLQQLFRVTSTRQLVIYSA
jgi:hypothetical protein